MCERQFRRRNNTDAFSEHCKKLLRVAWLSEARCFWIMLNQMLDWLFDRPWRLLVAWIATCVVYASGVNAVVFNLTTPEVTPGKYSNYSVGGHPYTVQLRGDVLTLDNGFWVGTGVRDKRSGAFFVTWTMNKSEDVWQGFYWISPKKITGWYSNNIMKYTDTYTLIERAVP